ncbi:MAG: nickel pincer cofactor biosynthesis protein LarC, partial [Thermodesulfobacteriota bacterium]
MNDTLYLDCFAGISGDMTVGALLDCGVSVEILQEKLAAIELTGYRISAVRDQAASLAATSFKVEDAEEQPARHWSDIKQLLTGSRLNDPVKEMAIAIFSTLAKAEAKIHNCPVEQVHFHEVGAVDSIIDIVAFAICYEELGIKRVVASPQPMPGGTVSCAHGLLPLPAPAVCEILKEVPVYGVDLKQELVTPTGAAIIKTVAESFGPFPSMTFARVGYGRGSRELADGRPNLLRAVLGRLNKVEEAQEIEVIDCNLDDWSPEGFPLLAEKLFALGALDVALAPI